MRNSTDRSFLNSSFIQGIIQLIASLGNGAKAVKKEITKSGKRVRKITKKYYFTFQRIQLSFIYFFAMVVLMYSIKNSLGFFPELLYTFFPFSEQILNIQFFKILATPEKTFILYLLVLEILINRSVFNFSLLIKFNVLLIFILEMVQNLIMSYWDLLFNRELDLFNGTGIIAKNATILFYCYFFVLFFLLYFYCYIRSLQGFFPSFPGAMGRITDSVAFWLQIKTSSEKNKDKKK